MSFEERIDALEEVRDVIASHNLPPIKQRKFNGIFNAMDIQIEDDDFSPEAVEHLGNAVITVAKGYRLDIQHVEEALAVVYQCLKRKGYMARFMTDETWARHANPWSGWTRVVTYPLLYVPIWLHNWYLLVIVAVWFAVNPRIFPKPRSTDNWMSKGVLGEQLWIQQWRWDFPMMLGIIAMPLFIGAVYTAYVQMFWATMFFASNVFVLKLWFLDRMVRFYEDNRHAK